MKIQIEALYVLNEKAYYAKTESNHLTIDPTLYVRTVKVHELHELAVMETSVYSEDFIDMQEYVPIACLNGSLIPFLIEKEKSKTLQRLIVEHKRNN